MKSIELTEDHKSKLLEMCKKLFPEIKILSGVFGDGSKCPEYILDYPVDLEWGTKWDLPYISVGTEEIHWFEFCMTHLYSQFKRLGIMKDDVFQKLQLGIHPVDYLYEEFKKLK